jgi:quinolinate synthase
MSDHSRSDYRRKISKLKEEKNALILAHYYQTLDIRQIADIVGDSFGLARRAKEAAESVAPPEL